MSKVFLSDVVWERGGPSSVECETVCYHCGERAWVTVAGILGSQWIGVGERTITGLSVELTPSSCPYCDGEYDGDDLEDLVAEALNEYWS